MVIFFLLFMSNAHLGFLVCHGYCICAALMPPHKRLRGDAHVRAPALKNRPRRARPRQRARAQTAALIGREPRERKMCGVWLTSRADPCGRCACERARARLKYSVFSLLGCAPNNQTYQKGSKGLVNISFPI